MANILKKDQKIFQKKFYELAKKYNFIKGEYNYHINTKYGKLNINIHDEQYNIYSIYCCFNNVELAKQHFDCNPYSGKYNFDNVNREYILECFEQFIMEIII